MIPALLRGTNAVTSDAHPYSLWLSGVDIINAVDRTSIAIDQAGDISDSSAMTFDLVDATGATYGWSPFWFTSAALRFGSLVQFYDHTRGTMHFAGWVANVRIAYDGKRGIRSTVRCIGYESIMDWCVAITDLIIPEVNASTATSTTVGEAIQMAVAHIGSRHLSAFGGTSYDSASAKTVDIEGGAGDPGVLVSDVTISAGTSLRSAIGSILASADLSTHAFAWVDMLGRIVVSTGIGSAPYNFDSSPTGGEIAPQAIEATFDSARFVSRVYIKGSTAAGTNWYSELVNLVEAPERELYANVPASDSWGRWRSAGQAYTYGSDDAAIGGNLNVTTENTWGWLCGQSIQVNTANLISQATTWYITHVRLHWGAKDRPVSELGLVRKSSSTFGGGQAREPVAVVTAKQYVRKTNT